MKYPINWIKEQIYWATEKIERDKLEEDKIYIHIDRLKQACDKFLTQK